MSWFYGEHANPQGAAVTVPELLELAIAEGWPVPLDWPQGEDVVKDTGVYPPVVRNSEMDTIEVSGELIAALDARKAS